MNLIAKQKEVCTAAGSGFDLPLTTEVMGFAMATKELHQPLHGLRHPREGQSSGWYIWRGDYNNADDFFEPLHISCLASHCEDALEFLALSPGWRFLTKGSYRDIWYDETLLNISSHKVTRP